MEEDKYMRVYHTLVELNRHDRNFLKCMYIYGLVLNNNTEELVEMVQLNNGVLFNLNEHGVFFNMELYALSLLEACINENKAIADIILNAVALLEEDIVHLTNYLVSNVNAFDFWITSYPNAFHRIYKFEEFYEFMPIYECLFTKFINNMDYNIPNDLRWRDRIFYTMRLFSNNHFTRIGIEDMSIFQDFIELGYPITLNVFNELDMNDENFYSANMMLFNMLIDHDLELDEDEQIIERIASWKDVIDTYGYGRTKFLRFVFSTLNDHFAKIHTDISHLEPTLQKLLITARVPRTRKN